MYRIFSLVLFLIGIGLIIFWLKPGKTDVYLPEWVKTGMLPPVQIPNKSQFVPGEVLVKYKENPDSKKKFLQEWREYIKTGNTEKGQRILQEQLARIKDKGEQLLSPSLSKREIQKTFPLLAIQHVKGASGEATEDLIKELSEMEDVEYVQKNYEIYPLSHNQAPPNENLWVMNHWLNNDEPPSKFWGLEKIGMKEVWNDPNLKPQGDIIVAVIDSGIDFTHPDLNPNMWKNPGELNKNTGEDDDGNEFVDDIHGANFRHNAPPGECQQQQVEGDISDEMGHGTFVAGIIAAAGNNQATGAEKEATSLLGINWQGHVKLMGLKIFCAGAGGSVADAIAAIEYALEMHAHIINASWIVPGVEEESELQGLLNAIKEANSGGVLFVTGAGNRPFQDESEKWNNDKHHKFPANFQLDNVMAVAATYRNDSLSEESNWGPTKVHMSAPGAQIFSTFSRSAFPATPIAAESGTSFAAPFVAGCAAYLQAIRKAQGKPFLTPKTLREKLMETGDQPKVQDSQELILSKEIDGQRVNLVMDGRRLNCATASQQVANLSF